MEPPHTVSQVFCGVLLAHADTGMLAACIDVHVEHPGPLDPGQYRGVSGPPLQPGDNATPIVCLYFQPLDLIQALKHRTSPTHSSLGSLQGFAATMTSPLATPIFRVEFRNLSLTFSKGAPMLLFKKIANNIVRATQVIEINSSLLIPSFSKI